jgi:hypothetical protein
MAEGVYTLDFVVAPPPPRRGRGAGKPSVVRSDPTPDAPRYIAPDSNRPHGSYVKAVQEKCRCEPCEDAKREYNRKRNHAISRPDEVWMPYVPAGTARRHLAELAEAGIGLKQVARVSGLSHGALSKLVYGDAQRGQKPSKRIRPETEARILAVTADLANFGRGAKIPAGPTWVLLEDLIARGYPKCWIARQLGSNAKTTHPGLQVRRDLVRAETARKVRRLHAGLEGKQGPGRTSSWPARRAREAAEAAARESVPA